MDYFLIAIAASFPLYFIRFSVGNIPFTVPEVLILIAGLVYGIRSFYFWYRQRQSFFLRSLYWLSESILSKFIFWKKEKELPWWQSPWWPIALLILSLFLALVVTPSEFLMRGAGIIKSWFLIPIFYFFLLSRLISDKRKLRMAFDAYAASALIVGVWGIYQWISGDYITPDMRASGPYESANYLALFLAPACVYLLFRAWTTYKSFASLWYAIAAVIGFFALYQTKSFGAFLGVIAGILFYCLYYWKQYSKYVGWKKISAIGVLILFFGVVFFATGDQKKFEAMFRFSERSSTSVRLQVWKVSRQFIAEKPFAGIGLGTYQYQYEKRASSVLGRAPFEPSMLHPHNVFLMFWLSSGFLGLAAFVWLLVVFFARFRALPKEYKDFGVILSAMMMVILVHGLVDVPIWKNDLALQFWLIVAGMRGIGR